MINILRVCRSYTRKLSTNDEKNSGGRNIGLNPSQHWSSFQIAGKNGGRQNPIFLGASYAQDLQFFGHNLGNFWGCVLYTSACYTRYFTVCCYTITWLSQLTILSRGFAKFLHTNKSCFVISTRNLTNIKILFWGLLSSIRYANEVFPC